MIRKQISKQDSDPNFAHNLETMTCNFEFMMDLLTDSQSCLVIPDFINRFGIDKNLNPVKLNFTGKIVNSCWEEMSDFFADDRSNQEIEDHRSGNIHKLKNTSFFSLKRSIVSRISPEILSKFSKVVTGDDIHQSFKNDRPGSCMRYEKCQPWQMLYVNNPDDVDLIVFGIGCGLMSGRTCSWLRWKGRETSFFDKLYAESDSILIEKIREKLGPLYGVVPNVKNPRSFKLIWKNSHRLPYMDTFLYCKSYNEKDETITLTSIEPYESGVCLDKFTVRNHEFGWHPTNPPEGKFLCESCNNINLENDQVILSSRYGFQTLCSDCVRICRFYEDYAPASRCISSDFYIRGVLRDGYLSEHAINRHFTRNCFDTCFVSIGEELTLVDGSICSPSDLDNGSIVIDAVGGLRRKCDSVKVKDQWISKENCVLINYIWYDKSSNEVFMDNMGEWKLLNPIVPQEETFYANNDIHNDYSFNFLDKDLKAIYDILARSYESTN